MSKDKTLPATLEQQTTDLTAIDQERISKFFEHGAKGFNLADEVNITKMLDLYLGGKTYSQISRITRIPKDLILAYSQRLSWFEIKNEYIMELKASMRNRVIVSKMESQDFLLQLSQMYQKKIGKKMDEYNRTGNVEHADTISNKDIDAYLKSVRALQELSDDAPKKGGSAPLVGLNVGDGATLTQNQDGSVDITPKSKAIGSMLEQLANQRRASELEAAEKSKKTSDIKDVTLVENKNKGDQGEGK